MRLHARQREWSRYQHLGLCRPEQHRHKSFRMILVPSIELLAQSS